MDFFIKTIGRAGFYANDVKFIPIGIEDKFYEKLSVRVMILNCVISNYKDLWEEQFNKIWASDNWSDSDSRLKPFNSLQKTWSSITPLRNMFERRKALVEIDVIIAMALSINLDELVLMFRTQFPVLEQNENDTWYDQKGNIVFTIGKGLTGVGLDRPEWEKITEEVNPMQRKLKDGDTYIHTIKKSELYLDQQITYYAPFDKCDRVEDYKMAWAHFEKIFSSEIKEKETSIKK